MKIVEVLNRPIFFLRNTLDPEGDLVRGFSCHIDGWTDDQAFAVQQAKTKSLTGKPRQDPRTRKWCFDPEPGLSSFHFYDIPSLQKAVERIGIYAFDGELGLFTSTDYNLGVGTDGEDVFRGGEFLGFVPWDADEIARITNLLPRAPLSKG